MTIHVCHLKFVRIIWAGWITVTEDDMSHEIVVVEYV